MRRLSLFLLCLSLLFGCREETAKVVAVKDPNYQKAKSFLGKETDSAFYYFNQVATAAKDSLQTSYAYSYMAFIQSEAGDHFGGQESLTLSLRFLDTAKKENRKTLVSIYNELGMTSISLKNYDAAASFFEKAVRSTEPDKYRLIALNNQALAFQKKGAYSAALKIYKTIIPQIKEPETYARVLSNMARTKWLYQPGYQAAPELLKALNIRLKTGDQWGINASYSHLADYYRRSRPDSALNYSAKMYGVAQQLNSPDDKLEALDKLLKVAPSSTIKAYFLRYQELNDSLQTARNAAKNQFAYIRYQVEKKETDNLRLQKENTERKYQVIQRNILLFTGFVTFLILAGVAILWYRKRKRLQDEEKRQAVQETQHKASKKVHDTLSNDIYRIMKKIQHDPDLDKEWLLDNIDDVYKRSRDISYDIIQPIDEHFHERLSELLKSFATEEIKVVLVGNGRELWQKVNATYKIELKYVLQELMVNMQKHSQATNIVIKFEEQADQYIITYFDNGVGLQPETAHKNGLKNTGNRIKGIGGQITFDSGTGKGLQIQIVLPAV